MVIRGEILIELRNSWLVMKTIEVELSMCSYYRVQYWIPELEKL